MTSGKWYFCVGNVNVVSREVSDGGRRLQMFCVENGLRAILVQLPLSTTVIE